MYLSNDDRENRTEMHCGTLDDTRKGQTAYPINHHTCKPGRLGQRLGRYVTVMDSGTNKNLVVCEVQVFGYIPGMIHFK